MRKFTSGAIAALLIAAGGIALAPAASATESEQEVCTPADAWTETIEHEAVGEPQITVDNPDYVAPTYTPAHEVVHPPVYTPPVGKPTIVIDNPEYVAAWTEVIEHEAVVCPPVEEPTEEPTDPEEPTTPATPEEPAAEEPVTEEPVTASLAMTSTDDMLAQTGADPTVTVWGLTAGALAVALGTLSVVFGLRRRQMMNQQ